MTSPALKRCPSCDRLYDERDLFCSADGTALVRDEPDDPLIGQIIGGRYVIERRLGAGGMGVVYRAVQSSVGRAVALKVLHPDRVADDTAKRRFMREARAISQLTSPHTVILHDFGEMQDGQLFLVMELLAGRTLADKLAAEGALPLRDTARILGGVTEALAEAHAQGIIHRDLKPENVFLASTHANPEFVKVLDFGLAIQLADDDDGTLTRSGHVPGSPAYLAPERVQGSPYDERADIYALGVMLYEMLAGRRPFRGRNVAEIVAAHVWQDPEPLEQARPGLRVPTTVANLLSRALAKDPALRPADAAAFRRLLEEAMPDAFGVAGNFEDVTTDRNELLTATVDPFAPASPDLRYDTPPTPLPVPEEIAALRRAAGLSEDGDPLPIDSAPDIVAASRSDDPVAYAATVPELEPRTTEQVVPEPVRDEASHRRLRRLAVGAVACALITVGAVVIDQVAGSSEAPPPPERPAASATAAPPTAATAPVVPVKSETPPPPEPVIEVVEEPPPAVELPPAAPPDAAVEPEVAAPEDEADAGPAPAVAKPAKARVTKKKPRRSTKAKLPATKAAGEPAAAAAKPDPPPAEPSDEDRRKAAAERMTRELRELGLD